MHPPPGLTQRGLGFRVNPDMVATVDTSHAERFWLKAEAR